MSKPRVELPEGCVPGKCYTGDPSIKICLPSCPEFPGDQLACPITLYRAHEGGICSAAAIAAFHAVDLVPYEPPKPRYEVELADPQPEKVFGKWVWSYGKRFIAYVQLSSGQWVAAVGTDDFRNGPPVDSPREGWYLVQGKDLPREIPQSIAPMADTWYFWREVENG